MYARVPAREVGGGGVLAVRWQPRLDALVTDLDLRFGSGEQGRAHDFAKRGGGCVPFPPSNPTRSPFPSPTGPHLISILDFNLTFSHVRSIRVNPPLSRSYPLPRNPSIILIER